MLPVGPPSEVICLFNSLIRDIEQRHVSRQKIPATIIWNKSFVQFIIIKIKCVNVMSVIFRIQNDTLRKDRIMKKGYKTESVNKHKDFFHLDVFLKPRIISFLYCNTNLFLVIPAAIIIKQPSVPVLYCKWLIYSA